MAAAKPEVLTSQLLGKVETKFAMLYPHFWGPASQWSCRQHCGIKTGSQKSKMAAAKPVVLISQLLDKVETKL